MRKVMHPRSTIGMGLLLVVFWGGVACGKPDPEKMSPQERLAYARSLYQRDCAACHGESGDGAGGEAFRMQTKPADFTSGHFKFKSTPSGQLPLDKDLFRTIREGVPTTAMLPQAHLTDAEVWALVDFIKQFYPGFGQASRAKPIAIPPPPVFSPELQKLGAEMFRDAGCIKCHGPEGHGDGPAADSLRDDRGNPVKVPDLTYLPRKIGPEMKDLYRVLQTGLDGTPMPSYQGVFSAQQAWALVYFLESIAVNRRPGGMMGLVGEEVIGMRIDMRAARAMMMRRRGMGRMMGRGMMGRRKRNGK
ncbi:cytochrome c [Candidatus Parcubacteria bacterium]|nr:MAG: cytochrome c [Candidatus Parcubacteria bacterium]